MTGRNLIKEIKRGKDLCASPSEKWQRVVSVARIFIINWRQSLVPHQFSRLDRLIIL